jgi:hypothetical protein
LEIEKGEVMSAALLYFSNDEVCRRKLMKLSVAILAVALFSLTNVFPNALMMLMDGVNFIPSESSIFSFKPYEINEGSSNYWIYGEDGKNYYYFSYEPAAPYVFIRKSNACPSFDRLDHATWCAAEGGGQK